MTPHGNGAFRSTAAGPAPSLVPRAPLDRAARESAEATLLTPGATRAVGAGRRTLPEEPDTHRTCFERDRDRILHAPAFRRLADKTQVFIFPTDHQRTRLTHAHEVAQVAGAIATAVGLNVALTTAIALGHDCGHGPGGHASEDALALYLPDGFEHGPWGADETLAPLNLCAETLDGIRNHSWSRPAPATPEALVVRWADRIAYCCHDLEDAVAAGIVHPTDLSRDVGELLGVARGSQLRVFIRGAIEAISTTGEIVLAAELAEALAELRRFNHERIYLRPASLEQGRAVTRVLQALVEHVAAMPHVLPSDVGHDLTPGSSAALHAAVRWVAGMTDRYACDRAVELLGWPIEQLPRGLGVR